MRISKRAAIGGIVAASWALIATNCEPPDDCLRNSDCDQGLACAAGHCVVPPPSPDDASESDVASGTDAISAADTTTTTVFDAAVAESAPQETAARLDAAVDDAAEEPTE